MSVAMEAVLKASGDLPEGTPKIRGYDFNQGVDLQALLASYITTGFQASSLGLAIQEINLMVRGAAKGGLTKKDTLTVQSVEMFVSAILFLPRMLSRGILKERPCFSGKCSSRLYM